MRYVEPSDMPVPVPSQIGSLDTMGQRVADERRPDREPVLIEVYARPVVVEQKAELRCVAFPYRILAIEIDYIYILVPQVTRIQVAVRILLQQVEIRCIVLIPVACVIPEQARAQIHFAEYKASEVADERLNAGSDRRCIEIGALPILAATPSQKRE